MTPNDSPDNYRGNNVTRYEVSPLMLFPVGKIKGGNVKPRIVVLAAAYDALARQLAEAQAERDMVSGQYADLMSRHKVLVKFYDDHAGTPCEQIRHQQEIDTLTAKLAAAESAVQISTNAFCMQTNLIATLEQRLAAMGEALNEITQLHKNTPVFAGNEMDWCHICKDEWPCHTFTYADKAMLEGEGGR